MSAEKFADTAVLKLGEQLHYSNQLKRAKVSDSIATSLSAACCIKPAVESPPSAELKSSVSAAILYRPQHRACVAADLDCKVTLQSPKPFVSFLSNKFDMFSSFHQCARHEQFSYSFVSKSILGSRNCAWRLTLKRNGFVSRRLSAPFTIATFQLSQCARRKLSP